MKKIVYFIALALWLRASWSAAQQPTTTTSVTKANAEWVQGVGTGYWPTTGTGLSIKIAAGTAFCAGAIQNYAGGTLSLTASATNYIYLNPASNCKPSASTTGFTTTVIPIAIATTSTSAVTSITDVRTEFVSSGSAPVVAGSCPSNQFVTAVGSTAPTCAQPAFSSLSGTAAITQLPLASATSAGILQLTGDISGSASGPVVAGLQGIPVSSTPPAANQFLGWNGSQWAPIQPSFSSVSGFVAAGQLPGATASSAGAVQLTGDLGGTSSTPRVTWLQGYPLSSTAPSANQVLTYNGSTWAPASPAAAAGLGACSANQYVTGTTSGAPTCAQPGFSSLTGTASAAQLPAATASAQGAVQLAGDLGGSAAAPTLASIQGTPVTSTAPTSNQVLTYNGSTWAPASPAAAAGLGACSANQYVTGTTSGAPTCAQPAFSGLTGTATAAQLPAATASAPGVLQLTGDLGGTSSTPRVTWLQGYPLSSTAPSANQVLTYNGTSWTPDTPPTGGAPGGSTTQFEFNNSGAFGGTSNLTYASGTGVVTLNQLANGNDTFYGVRSTDTSPTGNLIHFQNNAKTVDLFKVDASGNVTAASFTSTATGPFVLTGTEGTCAGGAAGEDVLCLGNSTTHTAQLSLNGGSFVPIPQLAGDLGGTGASPQVVSTHLATPLTTVQGGSGAGTFTAHTLLLGEGTSSFAAAGPGTSGQCLLSNGSSADPSFAACPNGGGAPGGSTTQFEFNNSGAFGGTSNLTYASSTGIVTLNQLANGNETFYGARSTDTSPTGNLIHFQNNAKTVDLFKVDASGNVTAASFTSTATGPFVLTGAEGTCAGGAAGEDVLCLGNSTTHTAQLSLNGGSFVPIPQLAGDLGGTGASPQVISTHLAAPLTTVQGGSGAGTFTAHTLLLGEGTSAFAAAGPGTSGQCLLSNGASADPSFAACPSGGGAPGGSTTQFEFNNSGAFGGTSNLTYASGTGVVTLNQLANGNDTFYGVRSTDTSPTGNLIHFQNNAKTVDLFKVDASGNVTAASFTSTATGPFVLTGTEGTCAGGAAGEDVLCLGNSTTHTAQLSLNGGSFVPIPQLAGDLGGTGASPQVVSTHLGHLNQNTGSNDLAGTITISAATSASHTFAVAFASAPICVLTPTSMPASGVSWWVTATAAHVTATINASGTLTFNYICAGNPN